jgi:serine/threonine protein kinase
MAWAEGTVLNDKYIIAKEIGNGGFGLTYLAYKRGSNDKVAIKTLKDAYAFDPILHDEFRKEILSLSKCNHPQIVTIEGFGDYESGWLNPKSQLYMVMEYIKGQTVFERMQSREKQGNRPQFSENDALFYIRQVASALVFAHNLHSPILHRDLKPQNIMLREDRPEAVLIDFGLARNVAANPESTAKLTFSAGFAPIEQYSYKPIRLPATDVYGLAATLYYMLTAKVPTDANDFAQGEPLINPKQHNPNISDQTCEAIMEGLKFKLADRPQTMQEWLDLLLLLRNAPSIGDAKRRLYLPLDIDNYPNLKEVMAEDKVFYDLLDHDGYNNCGLAKYKLGNQQGAIADYNEAIRLKPSFAFAYNNRGLAKYELGDKKGAIADYNKAIRLNFNYALAYRNRGNAKSDLGDKKGAIADYNEAIRINPDLASAYYDRGKQKYELGDKKGAIADYNEAIRINPNATSAYYNRGLMKDELGDKQGAIADYNEAIRINPNAAAAYYNRGLIKKSRAEKQEALADFRKAAELDQQQGNTEFYNNSRDRIRELGG